MKDIPLYSKLALSIQGEYLADFISVLPCSGHVRDIKKDKYLIANQYQAYNQGMKTIQQVLDITSVDLWDNYSALHARLNASFVQAARIMQRFEKATYQVVTLQKPAAFREEWLMHDGSIYVGINQKIPILGNSTKKTVGIFTISREITLQTNLFDLYGFYKDTYCAKSAAIKHFLRYLRLEKYFFEVPEEVEVLVLLALSRTHTYPLASKLIQIKANITTLPPESIEAHVQNLGRRLKVGYTTSQLFLELRKQQVKRQKERKGVDNVAVPKWEDTVC